MKPLNTRLDYIIKAQLSDGKSGDILIGDKGLEFYTDRSAGSCIQIPWNRIERVRVVTLHEIVAVIHIDCDTSVLSLFSKDNISLLKCMRRYLDRGRFIQEKTFAQKIIGKA